MKANRITLVTLGVSDVARSVAYYSALGWQPEEVMEHVAFFDMGGAKFGLFSLAGLAKEQGRDVAELGTGAQTLAQTFPDEAAVDAACAAALAAGATQVTKPVKTDWGGYSGYVADPDGHIWEFAYNPFWPLDDEGDLA
jgi:catechol 2,3-dioxygenase-like lactoylglutathione lyase family enzyme